MELTAPSLVTSHADVTKRLIQKGVIGQKAPLTNMFCMDFDEEGWAYTGGENG